MAKQKALECISRGLTCLLIGPRRKWPESIYGILAGTYHLGLPEAWEYITDYLRYVRGRREEA